MQTSRRRALAVLLEADPQRKAAAARALPDGEDWGAQENIADPGGIPGRPARPVLVPHTALGRGSLRTPAGRGALLHSLAHIEFNAIDLALDLVWRFPGMPPDFYRQWTQVAREEALHFQLLCEHLRSIGFDYGDFPAHNALWEMAERTKHDLLARVALVPRTLEARGLDASPQVRARLVGAGDAAAGAILDLILRDEIGHVALGNRWFRVLCAERALEPLAAYAALAERFGAPRPRGPFNLEARRQAGFEESELAALAAPPTPTGAPG